MGPTNTSILVEETAYEKGWKLLEVSVNDSTVCGLDIWTRCFFRLLLRL